MLKNINLRANIALGLVFAFLVNTSGPTPVYAQEFTLPAPGQMVALSPAYSPAVLKGIKLDPQNPFRFHFFVDSGDKYRHLEHIDNRHPERSEGSQQEQLKIESTKLIKYFLASLTIPEKDLWVNLSPYEKDRIVPQEFGQTEMGRDLLAEDYLLKQITASLIYPESQLGKEFWQKVYAKAQAKYGTTNIPVNTFNKVWIVPQKAVVYENGGVAFVLENHLKVMLEQDYLSLQKHSTMSNTNVIPAKAGIQDTNVIGSQIIREIVIPALTKEVNEGKNFAQLRQVFYSLILATWYKKKIKDSILNKVYSNLNKIGGVNVSAEDKDRIYQEYLKAFKKGVFNYVKDEPDVMSGQIMPRKYFSGGVQIAELINPAIEYRNLSKIDRAQTASLKYLIEVTGNTGFIHQSRGNVLTDKAMNAQEELASISQSIINMFQEVMIPMEFKSNDQRYKIQELMQQLYTVFMFMRDREYLEYTEKDIVYVRNSLRNFDEFLKEYIDGDLEKAIRLAKGYQGDYDYIEDARPVFTEKREELKPAFRQIKALFDDKYPQMLNLLNEIEKTEEQSVRSGPKSIEDLDQRSHIVPSDVDLRTAFVDNSLPLHIEVGFGSGKGLMEMARANPKINYLGVELIDISTFDQKVIKEVGKLPNLRLVKDTDIDFFKSQRTVGLAQEIYYIMWHSNDDTVFQSQFYNPKEDTKNVIRMLAPRGRLFISTDALPERVKQRILDLGLQEDTRIRRILDFPHKSEEHRHAESEYYIFVKPFNWRFDAAMNAEGLTDPLLAKTKKVPGKDRAQVVNLAQKGGIDLNPAQMSMQVKKGTQDFKFDSNGIEIDAAQVTGATFSIESMEPVKNLPAILGLR